MITVLGATGRIGESLVYRLLQDSIPVKVVSRSFRRVEAMVKAGAAPAVTDSMNTEELAGLIAGSQAVFTCVPFIPRVPDYRKFANALNMSVAMAVQMSGVKRVVNLSSRGAQFPDGTGLIKTYYDVELRLNTLPVPEMIHLRIPFLMENLFGAIPVIRKWGALRALIKPDREVPVIAACDVAAIASEYLLGRRHSPARTVEVPCSDCLTMPAMARELGRYTGVEDLPYILFSTDQYRSWLSDSGIPEPIGQLLIEMQDSINSGRLYPPEDPQVEDPDVRTRISEFAQQFVRYLNP